MIPFLIAGGVAVAALFLEGCGSDHPESTNQKENNPDAGAPPTPIPTPTPSVDLPQLPSSSPIPSASSSAPPLTVDFNNPAFPACDPQSIAEWGSGFNASYLDTDAFKLMTESNPFCVKTPFNVNARKCADSKILLPFLVPTGVPDQRLLKFNLDSFSGPETLCQSVLSAHTLWCTPSPNAKDTRTCQEYPLLGPLLLNSDASLVNLLESKGSTGQHYLMVQLSNKTGVLLTGASTGAEEQQYTPEE